LGGIPFPTLRTTLSIVTSSTIATANSASCRLPAIAARFASTRPVTLPRICIIPTRALARPT